jgi:hypothetical protein
MCNIKYREAVAQFFSLVLLVDGDSVIIIYFLLIRLFQLIGYGHEVSFHFHSRFFKLVNSCLPSFASPTYPKSIKPSKGRRRELTEEENDEIKEAFELFDNDKDNELDYHEFKVRIFSYFSIQYRSLCLGWTSSIRFRYS